MIQRLTLFAAVNTFTGYGQLFCELFAGLERMGVFCSVRSAETSELFGAVVPVEIKSRLVHCPQPEPWELLIRNPFQLPTPGKKVAYYTMYESTRLPSNWVELLNKAEVVVVPCAWNKLHFAACGVIRPIRIIPLGFSPDIFHFRPMPASDKFVFGTAGRIAHGAARKGVRRAIDLFLETFKEMDDVGLQVKVHPDCDVGKVDDSRITVIKEHLPWHRVQQWFGGINCYLSLATAEGFGLWQIQSMAMGRPVIGCRYSGMAEYLTEQNAVLIPFEEKPVPEMGGEWAHMRDADIKKAMMTAYSNRDMIRQKGLQAAQDALTFTWDRTVTEMHQLLREVGAL